jgi:type IV pili sensor histidine kinase/response regulator
MCDSPVIDGGKTMVQAGSGAMTLWLMAAVSTMDTSLHESALANGGDQGVGRYQTTVPQPRPDQQDLLAAIVDIELSDAIKTVGEAIAAVLENSGYRLLSPNPAAPCQEELFELPLPAVHRRLGPLTLRQALEVLSGPAYQPATDPVKRLVSFECVPADESNAAGVCVCD